MTVWLFCILRNEAPMIGYFLRHYAPWVTKFVFYDGASTDGTRDIIRSCHTAELRDWPGSDGLHDDEFLSFANEQWKEAKDADWIIWADADEILYHPDILGVLSRYLEQDVEVPRIAGFTMVSKTFPTTPGQIYDEVRTGFPDDAWGKPAIFRKRIFWTVGRHSIDITRFKPRFSAQADIKLLHYRAMGVDYVRARHARNWARVPDRCRAQNFGTNCATDAVGHHTADWFEMMIGKDWPEVI